MKPEVAKLYPHHQSQFAKDLNKLHESLRIAFKDSKTNECTNDPNNNFDAGWNQYYPKSYQSFNDYLNRYVFTIIATNLLEQRLSLLIEYYTKHVTEEYKYFDQLMRNQMNLTFCLPQCRKLSHPNNLNDLHAQILAVMQLLLLRLNKGLYENIPDIQSITSQMELILTEYKSLNATNFHIEEDNVIYNGPPPNINVNNITINV